MHTGICLITLMPTHGVYYLLFQFSACGCDFISFVFAICEHIIVLLFIVYSLVCVCVCMACIRALNGKWLKTQNKYMYIIVNMFNRIVSLFTHSIMCAERGRDEHIQRHAHTFYIWCARVRKDTWACKQKCRDNFGALNGLGTTRDEEIWKW